jgi:hypothetical protein
MDAEGRFPRVRNSNRQRSFRFVGHEEIGSGTATFLAGAEARSVARVGLDLEYRYRERGKGVNATAGLA